MKNGEQPTPDDVHIDTLIKSEDRKKKRGNY